MTADQERAAVVAKLGQRVNYHCPYDETQLRQSVRHAEKHFCPCCHTYFDMHPHGCDCVGCWTGITPEAPAPATLWQRFRLAVREHLRGGE